MCVRVRVRVGVSSSVWVAIVFSVTNCYWLPAAAVSSILLLMVLLLLYYYYSNRVLVSYVCVIHL